MSRLTPDTDLSALFGLDVIGDTAPVDTTAVMCPKCHGKGKFTSYTGRVVGNCFACNGTGLQRSVGVVLKADDCPKCAGSGEYSPGRPCFACEGTGKINTNAAAAITVEAIEVAFASAQDKGIKRPKLRLDTFTFSLAPLSGKNVGSLYVKEGDEYLGKINAGQFHPVRSCDDATKARIVAAAADPHAAAKAYGMRTGSCSCCGRELTDPNLGIGPICASKYF
jgi:hypothetical protein